MCILVFQAKCLWGTKAADLWLELNAGVLHYLSIAMKMPADASQSAAAAALPADEQTESVPASEAAGGEAEHVRKSPKKKRRRFQPKRSPKKKAKKARQAVNEECEVSENNENHGSETEGE